MSSLLTRIQAALAKPEFKEVLDGYRQAPTVGPKTLQIVRELILAMVVSAITEGKA